jgi:hypothetical protein
MIAAVIVLGAGFGSPVRAEIKEPTILTRDQWKAKPANVANMIPQGPTYRGIVIHHVGVVFEKRARFTPAQRLHIIQDDHLGHRTRPGSKPWGDFAYHYHIDRTGLIAMARDPKYQGDSNTNYDMTGQLLIVLDGDFDKDKPTAEQLKSLDELTAWLVAKHNLTADTITGHVDLSDKMRKGQTSCPGKNLASYLPTLRDKTAAALKR